MDAIQRRAAKLWITTQMWIICGEMFSFSFWDDANGATKIPDGLFKTILDDFAAKHLFEFFFDALNPRAPFATLADDCLQTFSAVVAFFAPVATISFATEF